MNALRERYSSDATKQAIINAARSTLDTLRYKNERSFSFERFSAKMQKAYDDLESNGRAVHNGDIVDLLWEKIQDSGLQTYIALLKVDYQRNPNRSYKLILQDIAAEVAGTKKVTFAPGTRGIAATYTWEGRCPNEGVHTPDGSIYIGNYDGNKWHSDAVRPYHSEITQARGKDGNQPTRNDKKRVNAIKRSKRKLKKLKSQISAAKLKVAAAKTGGADNGDCNCDDDDADGGAQAGNEFGGKRAAKKKKTSN